MTAIFELVEVRHNPFFPLFFIHIDFNHPHFQDTSHLQIQSILDYKQCISDSSICPQKERIECLELIFLFVSPNKNFPRHQAEGMKERVTENGWVELSENLPQIFSFQMFFFIAIWFPRIHIFPHINFLIQFCDILTTLYFVGSVPAYWL